MLIKQKTSEQLYVMENNSNPLVQVYLSNEHAILCVVYKKAQQAVKCLEPSPPHFLIWKMYLQITLYRRLPDFEYP